MQEGATGADSVLAVERFRTADGTGRYLSTRTFDLPSGVTAADVRRGVIVVHGISPAAVDDRGYGAMVGTNGRMSRGFSESHLESQDGRPRRASLRPLSEVLLMPMPLETPGLTLRSPRVEDAEALLAVAAIRNVGDRSVTNVQGLRGAITQRIVLESEGVSTCSSSVARVWARRPPGVSSPLGMATEDPLHPRRR